MSPGLRCYLRSANIRVTEKVAISKAFAANIIEPANASGACTCSLCIARLQISLQ